MESREYLSKVQRFALTEKELKDLKKNNERAEVVRIKERFQFLPFISNEQAYDVLANYEETVRTMNYPAAAHNQHSNPSQFQHRHP